MKTLWWSILCFIIASACILLTGMLEKDLTIMTIGGILTGLCVIAMRGIDGYINTGEWFG